MLGKLDWYAALTAVERRKLADALIEETHEEGEAVVCEGEPANAMYIIKQGTVRVTKRLARQVAGQVPSSPRLPAEDEEEAEEQYLTDLTEGALAGAHFCIRGSRTEAPRLLVPECV